MRKVKIYEGTKTYMYPNGELATPERVLQDFPSVLAFNHMIETDENEEVMMSCQNLSVMRGVYNIDPTLTAEEAIVAIEVVINTSPVVSSEPTTEERIASALEFQTMMMIPTEVTE